ncbi:MAG: hypothetical protein NT157_00435 [Candidatus Micrarchaeota archaeon]|nr:hypothetical protein [Candidatus Micrarchaeota archaeon]
MGDPEFESAVRDSITNMRNSKFSAQDVANFLELKGALNQALIDRNICKLESRSTEELDRKTSTYRELFETGRAIIWKLQIPEVSLDSQRMRRLKELLNSCPYEHKLGFLHRMRELSESSRAKNPELARLLMALSALNVPLAVSNGVARVISGDSEYFTIPHLQRSENIISELRDSLSRFGLSLAYNDSSATISKEQPGGQERCVNGLAVLLEAEKLEEFDKNEALIRKLNAAMQKWAVMKPETEADYEEKDALQSMLSAALSKRTSFLSSSQAPPNQHALMLREEAMIVEIATEGNGGDRG